MQKRKHHYIPQFYLKKFTDPRFRLPEEPYIWFFEKGMTESKRKSPPNIAFEVGFYDFHVDKDLITQEVENNLAELEYAASLILKKVEKGSLPTIQEKQIFSEFIWTMQMRNTFQRTNQNKVIEDIHRLALKIAAEHPEYIKRSLVSSGESPEDITDERIEKIISLIISDNYDVKIPQEYSIMNMIENAQQMSMIISKMSWTLLKSDEQILFVTSDNPVVLSDPTNESRLYGPGFLSKKVEMTFPLTPKLCLLASWKEGEDTFHKIDSLIVAEINNRTIRYSHKYIFSSMKLKYNPGDGLLYFDQDNN